MLSFEKLKLLVEFLSLSFFSLKMPRPDFCPTAREVLELGFRKIKLCSFFTPELFLCLVSAKLSLRPALLLAAFRGETH